MHIPLGRQAPPEGDVQVPLLHFVLGKLAPDALYPSLQFAVQSVPSATAAAVQLLGQARLPSALGIAEPLHVTLGTTRHNMSQAGNKFRCKVGASSDHVRTVLAFLSW